MRIFTPNQNQSISFIERGKYLMAYRLTLIFTLVFLVMTVAHAWVELFAFIGYLSAFIITASALVYLIVSKNFKHLFLFYGISGTILSHFGLNFSLTTPHYVDFMWMIVSSLIGFVGLGRKFGLILLTLNAIGTFYFLFFTHNEHLLVIQPFTFGAATLAFVEIVLAFFALGYLMFQFIIFQNYSETKFQKANFDLNIQNSLILAKSNENTTLIKEIHHRVKNNLQIIISLLRLQQSEIINSEAKEQFTEAINRVMVMASIHQRLYQEKEVARIDLKSYLEDLADDLKKVFQNDKIVAVKIDSNYKEIDLKTVVPLGLLLNELISNSYKYAFSSSQKGEIKIVIMEKKTQFELTYSDNGKWKEKQEENSGFGLDLISILTEQLNGSFEFETGDSGTKYTFTFSKQY